MPQCRVPSGAVPGAAVPSAALLVPGAGLREHPWKIEYFDLSENSNVYPRGITAHQPSVRYVVGSGVGLVGCRLLLDL